MVKIVAKGNWHRFWCSYFMFTVYDALFCSYYAQLNTQCWMSYHLASGTMYTG